MTVSNAGQMQLKTILYNELRCGLKYAGLSVLSTVNHHLRNDTDWPQHSRWTWISFTQYSSYQENQHKSKDHLSIKHTQPMHLWMRTCWQSSRTLLKSLLINTDVNQCSRNNRKSKIKKQLNKIYDNIQFTIGAWCLYLDMCRYRNTGFPKIILLKCWQKVKNVIAASACEASFAFPPSVRRLPVGNCGFSEGFVIQSTKRGGTFTLTLLVFSDY